MSKEKGESEGVSGRCRERRAGGIEGERGRERGERWVGREKGKKESRERRKEVGR